MPEPPSGGLSPARGMVLAMLRGRILLGSALHRQGRRVEFRRRPQRLQFRQHRPGRFMAPMRTARHPPRT